MSVTSSLHLGLMFGVMETIFKTVIKLLHGGAAFALVQSQRNIAFACFTEVVMASTSDQFQTQSSNEYR